MPAPGYLGRRWEQGFAIRALQWTIRTAEIDLPLRAERYAKDHGKYCANVCNGWKVDMRLMRQRRAYARTRPGSPPYKAYLIGPFVASASTGPSNAMKSVQR